MDGMAPEMMNFEINQELFKEVKFFISGEISEKVSVTMKIIE